MNTTIKTLAVAFLLATALVITGTTASADATDTERTNAYRDAMWYFVPELGAWADELQHTVAAAELKPEMMAELRELIHRGEYMVYDLEGTAAPAELVDVHIRLTASVERMTNAARVASDDAASATDLLDAEIEAFHAARSELRAWLMTGITIEDAGTVPLTSGSGPVFSVAPVLSLTGN